jgi:ABC-2 type transport system permease protein
VERGFRFDLDALASRPARQRSLSSSRPWHLPPWLADDLALLIAKDLRLFLRDPVQLLQFGSFAGLLGFYVLMLPRLGHAFTEFTWWRPVVSMLNMVAVTMALATFTGRFVYPLLALEGRRLWVLALAPWPRSRIVTAKLLFALAIGSPVAITLVVLSGTLLHLPKAQVAYQTLVIACLSMGLTSGALGLGARLADYGEDNPAKLVAGYGGTINLLASLGFSAVIIAGASYPVLTDARWIIWLGCVLWTVSLSACWSVLMISLAKRWFGELDRNGGSSAEG